MRTVRVIFRPSTDMTAVEGRVRDWPGVQVDGQTVTFPGVERCPDSFYDLALHGSGHEIAFEKRKIREVVDATNQAIIWPRT
jgi:hypothetical protein